MSSCLVAQCAADLDERVLLSLAVLVGAGLLGHGQAGVAKGTAFGRASRVRASCASA